jgi:hypothetical protein
MYEADNLKEELKDQQVTKKEKKKKDQPFFFFSNDRKLRDINFYQVREEEKWLL